MTFIADSTPSEIFSAPEVLADDLVELQALELACIGGGIGDTVL